jgi:ABC-type transporter Mla subunit MlaD
MRKARSSIMANPVLVGAVTALVCVVAVFLAYNANQGLPFVPSTTLKFHASSGANLLPGNEVREGGAHIGLVTDMVPRRLPDGTVVAETTIQLSKDAGKLPADSTIDLRPRSVLGLKYVEVTRGRSKDTLEDGETIPADQVTYPVDLDDYNRTFDAKTRAAVQTNLKGFGNALSNRGASLNATIAELPRLLEHLTPVAQVLAADDTQLPRFLKEAGDLARTVVPVADRYAHSFSAGADTFEAWSRRPSRIRDTIRENAPTLRTAIRSFRVQRPFLADTARFSRALRDAAAVMPTSLPKVTDALRTGTPVLRKAPAVNQELGKTLNTLEQLASAPETMFALRGVTRLVDIVQPLIRFVGPYVTVCNYWNSAWTNVSEHLTEPDPTGLSQRTLLNQAPRTVNPTAPSIGSIGAKEPANGEPVVSGSPMNLHLGAYGAAITKDGAADCESGQRGYMEKLTHYNTDKNLKIVNDPHIPGVQGTTYTGRPRVPEGQTFSRQPESGPRKPQELDK